MEKQTREQELARLRDFGLIQFQKGRTQAISEFKEKLKKELFSEALERDMNINDSSLDRLSCDYINKIIEKTAKEMK